jgi:N-acyl amino acid synthase of PEP-CTERM/exosortase system
MFDKHFEAYRADVWSGVETSFRLRYQVYCKDMGWEDPERFPDQMEVDEYDSLSTQFLVRRGRSKAWIAAMRIIVAPLESLPIMKFTRIDDATLPESARDEVLEISRMCVVTKYRRRQASGPYDPDDSFLGSSYRAKESWILLGLLRAVRQFSEETQRRYWLFYATDPLARLVRNSGFDIKAIGPHIEHRGLRRPYLFDRLTGALDLAKKAPDVSAMWHSPGFRLFSELPEDQRGVRRGIRRVGEHPNGSAALSGPYALHEVVEAGVKA